MEAQFLKSAPSHFPAVRRNVGSISVAPEDKKPMPGSESNKNIKSAPPDGSTARKQPGQTISSPQSGSNAGDDQPASIDDKAGAAGAQDEFWDEGAAGGAAPPPEASKPKDVEEGGGGTTKCDD